MCLGVNIYFNQNTLNQKAQFIIECTDQIKCMWAVGKKLENVDEFHTNMQ